MPCLVCSGEGFQKDLCDECVEELSPLIHYEIYEIINFSLTKSNVEENLDILKHNLETLKKCNKFSELDDYNDYLTLAVENEQFAFAELFLKMKPELMDEIDHDYGEEIFTFNEAARRGKIRIAKWILKINPSISNETLGYGLYTAIGSNRFKFAQWLVKLRPGVKDELSELELYNECEFGNSTRAKMILTINPSISIQDRDFDIACIRGNYGVVEWLAELNPERYKYRILNDNTGANKIEPQIDHSALKLVGMVEREKETCCICQTNNVNCETRCDHRYCLNCIKSWFNSSKSGKCPYCRCKVGAEVKMVKFV